VYPTQLQLRAELLKEETNQGVTRSVLQVLERPQQSAPSPSFSAAAAAGSLQTVVYGHNLMVRSED